MNIDLQVEKIKKIVHQQLDDRYSSCKIERPCAERVNRNYYQKIIDEFNAEQESLRKLGEFKSYEDFVDACKKAQRITGEQLSLF